jgi:trans-2,3-dihydro-3-hydroxyanthranilate isomerase
MTELNYRLLNVFTCNRAALSGNALCVFESGLGLDTATMQALARQFNLSETTFILPPSTPTANAQVRIFTPSYELPFAGHPTLGTAAVCRSLELGDHEIRLEMQAGIIPVVATTGGRWTLSANAPSFRELPLARERLAALLGLQRDEIAERPLWVKSGREQLIVPLTSADAVRRAAPGPQIFQEARSEDGAGMAYLFAEVGPGRVLARFFFPQGTAVLEDPATGSATANLGGWWLAMGRPLPCALTASQGEQVARPSTLFLNVEPSQQIRVGGDVIEIGRGRLTL